MKITKLLCVVGSLIVASTVTAQVFSFNFTPNQEIPDSNQNGISDTRTITGVSWPLPASGYYNTAVFLNIVGTPPFSANNSDYYATLVNPSTGLKSVLLNRVGKGESGFPFGYLDNGVSVKLSDSAANGDIHVYRNVVNPLGGTLTGTWAPDGRDVLPESVVTGDPRSKTLSQFNGINPNGDWILLVADIAGGQGLGTLASWGLEFTAVPEPQTYAMAVGLALLGFGGFRRFMLNKA